MISLGAGDALYSGISKSMPTAIRTVYHNALSGLLATILVARLAQQGVNSYFCAGENICIEQAGSRLESTCKSGI